MPANVNDSDNLILEYRSEIERADDLALDALAEEMFGTPDEGKPEAEKKEVPAPVDLVDSLDLEPKIRNPILPPKLPFKETIIPVEGTDEVPLEADPSLSPVSPEEDPAFDFVGSGEITEPPDASISLERQAPSLSEKREAFSKDLEKDIGLIGDFILKDYKSLPFFQARAVVEDFTKAVFTGIGFDIASGATTAFNNLMLELEKLDKAMTRIGLPTGFFQLVDEKGNLEVKFIQPDEKQFLKTLGLLKPLELPVAEPTGTVTGSIVRSLSQYAAAFLPMLSLSGAARKFGTQAFTSAGFKLSGKLGKPLGELAKGKPGQILKKAEDILATPEELVAGMAAASLTLDPHGARLSTLLNEFPVLNKLIPDMMADFGRPTDFDDERGPLGLTREQGESANLLEDTFLSLLGRPLIAIIKVSRASNQVAAEITKDIPINIKKKIKQDAREAAIDFSQPLPLSDLDELGNAASDELFKIKAGKEFGKKLGKAARKVGRKGRPLTPESEIELNMNRMDSPEEVKRLIVTFADEFADDLNRDIGGPKTFGKTLQESNLALRNLEDVLGRPPGPMPAAEGLAVRRLLLASGKKGVELARRVNTSKSDKIKYLQWETFHYTLQSIDRVNAAELGRALGARRIVAKSDIEFGKMADVVIEDSGGSKSVQVRASLIIQNADNPAGLNLHNAATMEGKYGDALATYWANNVLSGLSSSMINLGGNFVLTHSLAAERAFSAAFSQSPWGTGTITFAQVFRQFHVWREAGRQGMRLMTYRQKQSRREPVGRRVGEPEPLPLAFPETRVSERRSQQGRRTERRRKEIIPPETEKRLVGGDRRNPSDELGDLVNELEQFKKFEGVGGANVNAALQNLKPSRGLTPGQEDFFNKGTAFLSKAATYDIDIFFNKVDLYYKGKNYYLKKAELAQRRAEAEGTTSDEIDRLYYQHFNNPPADLRMEGVDYAAYATLTNRLGDTMGPITKGLKNVPWIGRWLTVFTKTMTQITSNVYERTPLELLSRDFAAEMAAGGARKDVAVSRIAGGSMLLGHYMTLAQDGIITPSGALDPDMRAHNKRLGVLPSAIRIGEEDGKARYFTIDKLDPPGLVASIAADLAPIFAYGKQEDVQMAWDTAVMTIAQQVVSKRQLSTLFDFAAAIDPSNPYKSPADWVERWGQGFIPKNSFLRRLNRAIDPEARILEGAPEFVGRDIEDDWDPKAKDVLQGVVNRILRDTIPGYSKTLPKNFDVWGEPIVQQTGWGPVVDFMWTIFSPIKTSLAKQDPVNVVIRENRIPIPWIGDTIEGVRLTPEQISFYRREAGQRAKKVLDDLINGPQFRNVPGSGPNGMKSIIVQKFIEATRKQAKALTRIEFPELQEKILFNEKKKIDELLGIDKIISDDTESPPVIPIQPNEVPDRSVDDLLGGIKQ